MAENPLNGPTAENKPASGPNINVGGNVGGNLIVGDHNVINMTPAQQIFRSLHQLPQPPADFTGRAELIAQLLADFESGKGAAVTAQPVHGLVGMGGIGKTALGLVVAHQLKKDYPDAQIFLDLKGTTTPLSAIDIMRHVILSFEPTMDVRALDETNMSAVYRSLLDGKRALLFLDNARSAEQVAPLRPPETCTLLVTSRWTFGVPGLKNRHVDVMSQENTEKFLLELCPRIGETANELAKACGYLPLALRIAGSFLQVNTDWKVENYLAQLNDRKGRLATLQKSRAAAELTTEPDLLATFELSYSRLLKEDRKRWRMLGIFPASFALTAAAAMWNLEENETTELLSLLLRYSLLNYEEISSRYSLHDLLADYGLSQMEAKDEEQCARLKHASYYKVVLGLAGALYGRGGENVPIGLRLLDLEWDNIRAGQAWVSQAASDRDSLELCNEYPGVGSMILFLRLPPREYISWLRKGLAAARELGNKQNEGEHLSSLGNTYKKLGNIREAIEFHEQALVISREIRDRLGEESVLGNLGNAYAGLGDARKAIEFYEQALVISREIGDRGGEGNAFNNLGNAYRHLGQTHRAIGFFEQALLNRRQIGDWRGTASALGNLGLAYAELGDARKAIQLHEQALVIRREIGDRRSEADDLGNLGNAYAQLGDARKAMESHEQALVIHRETEDRRGEAADLGNLAIIYAYLGEARKAIEFYQRQFAIAHEIGDRHSEGNALFNMGSDLYKLEEKDRAVDLVKQALEIYEVIESPNVEMARTKLKEWGAL